MFQEYDIKKEDKRFLLNRFLLKTPSTAFWLMCHAAVPVFFRLDWLYHLKSNFSLDIKNEIDQPCQYSDIADIIHSPFTHRIGNKLYEFDSEIRAYLLGELELVFGEEHIKKLAAFLYQYAETLSNPKEKTTHQTAAFLLKTPELALKALLDAFSNADTELEQVRLHYVLEKLMLGVDEKVTQMMEPARALTKMNKEIFNEDDITNINTSFISLKQSNNAIPIYIEKEELLLKLQEHLLKEPNTHQPAEIRIAECKRTKSTSLDLGYCGITNLLDYPELFELYWLEELILSNQYWVFNREEEDYEDKESRKDASPNFISFLPEELSKLSSLKRFVCGGSKEQKWDLSELSVLAKLPNLTEINLNNNQISDISFLSYLTNLEIIIMGENNISNISPIAQLKKLIILELHNNHIQDISPLANLTSLKELALSNNQIKDISPLESLNALTFLDIHSNQVEDLFPLYPLIKKGIKVSNTSWNRYVINVENNTLIFPNLELINHKDNKLILSYFETEYIKYFLQKREYIKIVELLSKTTTPENLYEKRMISEMKERINLFHTKYNKTNDEPNIWEARNLIQAFEIIIEKRSPIDKKEQKLVQLFNKISNDDIIKLLTILEFNENDLDEFCSNYFDEVYIGFNAQSTKNQKIIALIEYCIKHLKISQLMQHIKDDRYDIYQKYIAPIMLSIEFLNIDAIYRQLINVINSQNTIKLDKKENTKTNKWLQHFNMILIKRGTFKKGTNPEKKETIKNDFYIAKYPLTQELWVEVMGYNPSYFQGKENLPVENISWLDAQKFIAILNDLTDLSFRLPTEAQWEYAAKGGNKSRKYKYAGSNNINEVAWYSQNSDNQTHPVGMKKPNELGLYDMSGNVWEFTQNLYEKDERVIRGGSWFAGENYCEPSLRLPLKPSDISNVHGLRLCITNKPKEILKIEKKLNIELEEVLFNNTINKDDSNYFSLNNYGQIIGLNLRKNLLTDISFLSNLIDLQILDISDNNISDISPLKNLISLQKLILNKNVISDISSLSNLVALQQLWFNDNKVNDISVLSNLAQLKTIHFSNNNVHDIFALKALIEKGIEINCLDNPLTNPPIEVVHQGTEAVISYWREESQRSSSKYNHSILVKIKDIEAPFQLELDFQSSTERQMGEENTYIGIVYYQNTEITIYFYEYPIGAANYITFKNKEHEQLIENSQADLLSQFQDWLHNDDVDDKMTDITFPPQQIIDLGKKIGVQFKETDNVDNIMHFSGNNSYLLNENREVIGLNLSNHRSYFELSDLAVFKSIKALNLMKFVAGNTDKIDISPLASLQNLTALDLGSNKIIDITPLQYLTNLTTLKLSYNKIEDITPLKNLTNLQELYLSKNQIEDITILKYLPNLTKLGIANNKISDISVLGSLKNLNRLELNNNPIKDGNITILGEMAINLQELFLGFNNIKDISCLQEAVNLHILYLDNNDIQDIKPLSNLLNIIKLNITGNRINDITPLLELKKLEILNFNENKVSDLSPLSSLTKLSTLFVDNNQVNDISPLQNLEQLTSLSFNNNEVSNISVLSNLNHLKAIRFFNNKVQDISPLKALIEKDIEINCLNNPLTNPPIEVAQQGNKAVINYWQEQSMSNVNKVEKLNNPKVNFKYNGAFQIKVKGIDEIFDIDLELVSSTERQMGKENEYSGVIPYKEIEIIINFYEYPIGTANHIVFEYQEQEKLIENSINNFRNQFQEWLHEEELWDETNDTQDMLTHLKNYPKTKYIEKIKESLEKQYNLDDLIDLVEVCQAITNGVGVNITLADFDDIEDAKIEAIYYNKAEDIINIQGNGVVNVNSQENNNSYGINIKGVFPLTFNLSIIEEKGKWKSDETQSEYIVDTSSFLNSPIDDFQSKLLFLLENQNQNIIIDILKKIEESRYNYDKILFTNIKNNVDNLIYGSFEAKYLIDEMKILINSIRY